MLSGCLRYLGGKMKRIVSVSVILFVLIVSMSLVVLLNCNAKKDTTLADLLSNEFTGEWVADLPGKGKNLNKSTSAKTPKTSKPVRLKLCVIDDELEGTINTNKLKDAEIVSSTPISSDEVEIDIEDKKGNSDTLELTLFGKGRKKLSILFSDDSVTVAQKINLNKSCSASSPTPKSPQKSKCGNGKLDSDDEECDDGNTISNDGCSNKCELEE